MRVILILVAAAAVLMMLFPALAAGQAQFHEDFEDIGSPSYSHAFIAGADVPRVRHHCTCFINQYAAGCP